MNIKAALLIGGKSLRMGECKSLLPFGDTTLGHHLCGLLEQVTGTPPLLSGTGGIGPECDVLERVPDRETSAGPLSAVLGLFDRYPQWDFLVLATDLIAMNQAALLWLLEMANHTEQPTVWPRLPDRPFGEPLAAVYKRHAFSFLNAAWLDGIRGLKGALAGSHREQPLIPEHLRFAFTNVNHPEELAAARARMDQ